MPQLQQRATSSVRAVTPPRAASVGESAGAGKDGRAGIGFFEGFGGTVRGRLFEAPLWVDTTTAPGYTPQQPPPALTLRWFASLWYPVQYLWSVHLVWFACCLGVYTLFPYNFDDGRAARLDPSLVFERVRIHVGLCFAFFSFWTVCVYGLKMATRHFNREEEGPPLSRFIHNLWYVLLGATQAGVYDALLMMLYANNALPRLPDAQAFSLSLDGLTTVIGLLFAFILRDPHFFFCHIAIHLNYLYKHVHALHHRNIVIEPFSGLTMHPVEHMYYFGCMGITVAYAMYFPTSPLVPLWTLVHALVSPAASHSGVEDIWQSDQYHNLHHAKFECNYGTGGIGLDHLIGCFREKFGESDRYKGAWTDDGGAMGGANTGAPKATPKKFLRGGLTLAGALYDNADQALFDLVCCVLSPLAFYTALTTSPADTKSPFNTPVPLPFLGEVAAAQLMGVALAYTPVVMGLTLCALNDRKSWRWPFHEWTLAQFTPLYLGMNVVNVLPVAYFATLCVNAMRSAAA